MALKPGDIAAGRYEIRLLLGAGGMGEVFLAHDRELNGTPVALKIIRPALAQEESIFSRFRNEVLLQRSLAHANIARVFDLDKAPEGYYYITMEYVEGESLAARLKAVPPLSFAESVRILKEILDGVSCAHEKGIIHRDLKPSNVLLTKEGQVKIVDFGTARLVEGGANLTVAGEMIGTPAYMAPEQILGESLDRRCDIYSLGIIGYELAAGKLPYEGEALVSITYQHINAPLPEVPGAPAWYQNVLAKAAAKNPNDRFLSARDFIRALDRRSADSPDIPETVHKSSSKLPILLLLLLVSAAAAYSGFSLMERRRPRSPLIAASSQSSFSSTASAPISSPAAQDSVPMPAASSVTPAAPPSALSSAASASSLAVFQAEPSAAPLSAPSEVERSSFAALEATRSQVQLYFRHSAEREASSSLSLRTLPEVRWIAVLPPDEAPEQSDRFRLHILDKGGAVVAELPGSLLSLGSSVQPGARVGGSFKDIAFKIKSSGTYRADLSVNGKVRVSADISIE